MDDLKQTLDKLREELTNAGKRLADLAQKAEAELPEAGKRINEEYLRLQARVDVLGQLVRGRVVVHRRDDPEFGMGADLHSGHDRLDVTACVE